MVPSLRVRGLGVPGRWGAQRDPVKNRLMGEASPLPQGLAGKPGVWGKSWRHQEQGSGLTSVQSSARPSGTAWPGERAPPVQAVS